MVFFYAKLRRGLKADYFILLAERLKIPSGEGVNRKKNPIFISRRVRDEEFLHIFFIILWQTEKGKELKNTQKIQDEKIISEIYNRGKIFICLSVGNFDFLGIFCLNFDTSINKNIVYITISIMAFFLLIFK